MRALGLLCIILAGCAREEALSDDERRRLYDSAMDVGRLMRAGRLEEADSTASAWLARHVAPGAVDRLYEGETVYADTVAAFVLARQAYVRWELGDTTGTVRAYGEVLPYRALLPDSTAGRILRWMAWAASAGDPAEGLRLMDTAERWARERGLNREAAEIARCKAELLARIQQGEPCPPEDVVMPEPVTTDAGLLILAIAALISLVAYLLGRVKAHGVSPAEAAP